MIELEELNWTYPGGGSGPISIEDEFIEYAPNSTAICTIADDGGHTKEVRTEWGIAATGDISRRFAVRVRNAPEIRGLFLKRHNKQRVGNLIISNFTDSAGDIAGGIRLAEHAFRADYVGRVLPVSNENNIHLRVFLKDGSYFDGEDKLDEFMKTPQNVLIEDIGYFRFPEPEFNDPSKPIPEPYKPALKILENSDLTLSGPGSWEGSNKQVLKVPGVFDAMQRNSAPFVCITNAVDVKDRTADFYLKYMAENIGRKIDLALVDNGQGFILPPSYKEEHHFKVEPNERECLKYAKEVLSLPLTKVLDIEGSPTIRHDGKFVTYSIIKYLVDTDYLKLNKRADRALSELGSYLKHKSLLKKAFLAA